MKKILVTLATLAVSAVFALAGAPAAPANDDPGLCWNGWLWTACVRDRAGWTGTRGGTAAGILDMGLGMFVTAGSIGSS